MVHLASLLVLYSFISLPKALRPLAFVVCEFYFNSRLAMGLKLNAFVDLLVEFWFHDGRT